MERKVKYAYIVLSYIFLFVFALGMMCISLFYSSRGNIYTELIILLSLCLYIILYYFLSNL